MLCPLYCSIYMMCPNRPLLSALASLLGAARGVLVCLVTLGLKQLGNCTRKRLETIDSTISWHCLLLMRSKFRIPGVVRTLDTARKFGAPYRTIVWQDGAPHFINAVTSQLHFIGHLLSQPPCYPVESFLNFQNAFALMNEAPFHFTKSLCPLLAPIGCSRPLQWEPTASDRAFESSPTSKV